MLNYEALIKHLPIHTCKPIFHSHVYLLEIYLTCIQYSFKKTYCIIQIFLLRDTIQFTVSSCYSKFSNIWNSYSSCKAIQKYLDIQIKHTGLSEEYEVFDSSSFVLFLTTRQFGNYFCWCCSSSACAWPISASAIKA